MSDYGALRIERVGPPGSLKRRLLIDDIPILITTRDALRALELDDGDTVEASSLRNALLEEEPTWAHQRALRLLNHRDRSIAELSRRLREDGYENETITPVVDRLVELALLDDARFASSFVRSKVAAGWGRSRIRHSLEMAGVDDEVVSSAIAEEYPDDDLRRMRELAARTTVRTRKDADRLVSRLVRRGYDARDARRLSEELLQQSADD